MILLNLLFVIGVSEYKLLEKILENLRGSLPTIEE